MADSRKELGPLQPRTCRVCGGAIRWTDHDAFYNTSKRWSAHNKCLPRYGWMRLTSEENA